MSPPPSSLTDPNEATAMKESEEGVHQLNMEPQAGVSTVPENTDMKRTASFTLMLILLGGLSAVCAAQTAAPPARSLDYFPQRWKEFSSGEGGFKALFPGEPTLKSSTQETAAGKIPTHLAVYRSSIEYAVAYMDFPNLLDGPDVVTNTYDRARDGGLEEISKHKPRVVSEADITISGRRGRFLHIELEDQTTLRLKLLAVRSRVYMVTVTTPPGRDSEAKKDYERIATSFLDSVQAHRQLASLRSEG